MKKIFKYALIGAVAVGLASCEDKLDVKQHGVLNYDTYYQTDEDAEAAATAMYLQMRGLAYNYTLGKNMLTDDFWAGGAQRNDNADLEQLNEFTFGTDQNFLQGMFSGYYGLIYKANVVLGHVSEDTEAMRRARAEAKVFRAWAYFDLITMWGNPPLVDHELSSSEYSQPNGKTEELWALVETDLSEAINSGCLTEKTSVNDSETWRVTKQFAQAVLGKAYLWQGKAKEAAEQFDNVVKSGLYRLFDGEYENIWGYNYKRHCESMFESNRVNDPNNEWDNYDFMYVMLNWRTDRLNLGNPNIVYSNGWGFLVPQKNLYDDFVATEGADGYRLTQTMKTYPQIADMGITIQTGQTMINEGLFMWKWRYEPEAAGFMGMVCHQNARWMRYAEVLLLGAEAHLAAGNSGQALKYINEVRDRAKLAPLGTVSLKDIQTEKRLELVGEGTRYQDMIRWGIAADRLKSQGEKCPVLDSNGNVKYNTYNKDASKFGFKTGKHELLPYPSTEIRLNPNITQNPGW